LEHIDGGKAFDWGKASQDYAQYRDIYPAAFYQKICDLGLCAAGMRVLDLGTGTGVLPRALYPFGAKFTGADISENQITQARRLSDGLDIDYIVTAAEEVDFPGGTFDSVLACQCFWYFDAARLLPSLHRMLKDDGRLAILSLNWLPGESEIAAGSEALVLQYNPAWNGKNELRPTFGSDGLPAGLRLDPAWGFAPDTAFAFDVPVAFTRATWHGRIKACRGIGASALPPEEIAAWEQDHLAFMAKQPEAFEILHTALFCVLKKGCG
jgi:SAM-dependent methyltransferase